jgi:hypothetical protein
VTEVGELAVQHPLTVAEDAIRVVECIMVSECVIIIAMSSSSLARALSLVGIGLLTELGTPGVAPAADPSVVNEVQDLLQISADQRRSLAQGEVVSFPITENTDRELAVGLAMLVSAPLGRIVDYLASGQLIARDSTISEYGRMPDEVSSGAQAGTRFTSGERAEAESFLEASPGTRFNLSLDEIEALRALRDSTGSSARTAVVENVSEAYWRLLQQRLQAYRRAGLAAIVPYARTGGAVRDPSIDLRLAAADAERLARYGRELREALLRYPADQPSQTVNHFYWVKRRVQRRPHLSLLHRMVVPGPGPAIHVERYFYVGHSFNATEVITGALAHDEGTLVFCISRVSTDEILGLGNQLKRTVGRSQLRDEMRTRFDKLRASLSRPASVESP